MMNKNKRKSIKGQAVVEVALFGTLLIIITLVAYDLTTQVSKSQGIASAAREAARVFVAKNGAVVLGAGEPAIDSDAFDASKKVATQVLAPQDLRYIPGTGEYDYAKGAENNDSWNIIVHTITRVDSNPSNKFDDDHVLLISEPLSYPDTKQTNFSTKFKTKVYEIDSEEYDGLDNDTLDQYNLDLDLLKIGQSIVAVEMFYKAEFITGLDKLAPWAKFDSVYELAYY